MNTNYLALCLALCLLPNALALQDHHDEDVTTLTTENFNSFVKNKFVFIQYCSSRSGMCKFIDSQWEQFAKEVRALDLPVKLGKVDCTVEDMICWGQKIQAFPTLRWHHNGIPTDFHGKLTADTMLKIAEHQLDGAVPATPTTLSAVKPQPRIDVPRNKQLKPSPVVPLGLFDEPSVLN
jgi:thioredoxin-like negative regulator of GroEL